MCSRLNQGKSTIVGRKSRVIPTKVALKQTWSVSDIKYTRRKLIKNQIVGTTDQVLRKEDIRCASY